MTDNEQKDRVRGSLIGGAIGDALGVPNACEVFLFSEKKVRRGFFTHRTTINHTTRGKPLRLQKLSFLNPPPL